jgi:hypothetical protein
MFLLKVIKKLLYKLKMMEMDLIKMTRTMAMGCQICAIAPLKPAIHWKLFQEKKAPKLN